MNVSKSAGLLTEDWQGVLKFSPKDGDVMLVPPKAGDAR